MAGNSKTPPNVRLLLRRYQAEWLLAEEQAGEAVDLLQKVARDDPAEFIRVEAAIHLAELLFHEQDKPDQAEEILNEAQKKVKRGDLAARLREMKEHQNEREEEKTAVDREGEAPAEL